MFGHWKEDLSKGTDRLVEAVQEAGNGARRKLQELELKKDLFLAQKELGEVVFRLVDIEGRREIENDLRVRRLVHQIKHMEESLRSIREES